MSTFIKCKGRFRVGDMNIMLSRVGESRRISMTRSLRRKKKEVNTKRERRINKDSHIFI